MSGTPKLGSPELKNWDRTAGFEHPNQAVDDQVSLQTAKNRGYPERVAQDVAAMEINFDRLANGYASHGEALVPNWVAQRGADNPRHAAQVRGLISDSVRDNPQVVDPRAERMFLDTYDEAVWAARQGKSW